MTLLELVRPRPAPDPSSTSFAPRFPPARSRRRLPSPLLALAGAWAVVCAGLLILSYCDARAGARQVAGARNLIGSGQMAAAVPRLQNARTHFQRAHAAVSSLPLLPLRKLPVLGRQLESFAALTGAGSRVSAIAATTSATAADELRLEHHRAEERPKTLRRLAELAASAERELGQVPLNRRAHLVPPVARQWTILERDVAAARSGLISASEGLAGMASILEGPRRYLILGANNAEMRAGSGMFLSVGTVDIAGGSLRLGALRPTGDLTLPAPGVNVDGDLAGRWGWLQPGREWRNLGTTPRFDVTAPVAVRMWESATGEKVDGALALDVPALERLLAVTGPVKVGDEVVSTGNVSSRLLRDQYRDLSYDDAQSPRREELGRIAGAVVEALDQGDYPLPRLGLELSKSARGRHVLAWSAHEADRRTWEAAGITGSLLPSSLVVSVLNRGGNKLDPFLEMAGGIAVRPEAGGTAVTVSMNIANRAPDGLPAYVAGPHPGTGLKEGDYLGIVAVQLPGASTDVAVEGDPRPVAQGRDGPSQVVAVPVMLPRGTATTVAVHFRLPPEQTSIDVVPSARFPAVEWQAGEQRWRDDTSRVVSWRSW